MWKTFVKTLNNRRNAAPTLVAYAALVLAMPAAAELRSITIDGQILIRANWYNNVSAFNQPSFEPETRWPAGFLPGRATGFQGGPIVSRYGWDRREPVDAFVELLTRLGFGAEFSNNVSAYIEFDAYEDYGDTFRSDYRTGARAPGEPGIALYQAYIQADEMWGLPFSMRLGRQEIELGSGWLVGIITPDTVTGGSFDALRLDFETDLFSVVAFSSILADNFDRFGEPVPTRAIRVDERGIGGRAEQDATVSFHGVHANYYGIRDITLSSYWYWLRDPRSISDTELGWWPEFWEGVLGLDNYGTTNLHTAGLRAAGAWRQFDFDLEVAYQFGRHHQAGFLFAPHGVYGDDNLKHREWAFTSALGYTFETRFTPRLWGGVTYFSGSDNRDLTFLEWLNPWHRPRGSTAFNRLFSAQQNSEFFADLDETNMWIFKAGLDLEVTDSVTAELVLSHFRADEAFAAPVSVDIGRYRVPIAPALSFWTRDNAKDIGTEIGLYVTYNYTEALQFEMGIIHMFLGQGAVDGHFVVENGLGFIGGSGDDNPTYVYLEARIDF